MSQTNPSSLKSKADSPPSNPARRVIDLGLGIRAEVIHDQAVTFWLDDHGLQRAIKNLNFTLTMPQIRKLAEGLGLK
jgi:hypothetical protein